MNRRILGTVLTLGLAAAGSCAVDDRDFQNTFSLTGDAGPGGAGSALAGPRLDVTPASADLGWVTAGFAARTTVRITNSGDAPLAVPAVRFSSDSDPDFALVQNQCLG